MKIVYEGWISLKHQPFDEKPRWSLVNTFKRRWVVLFIEPQQDAFLQAYKDASKTSSLKAEINLNECSLIRQAKDNIIWLQALEIILFLCSIFAQQTRIPFFIIFVQCLALFFIDWEFHLTNVARILYLDTCVLQFRDVLWKWACSQAWKWTFDNRVAKRNQVSHH